MENHTNIMHPIIEFYQGKRKTRQFDLSLEEVWGLNKHLKNHLNGII